MNGLEIKLPLLSVCLCLISFNTDTCGQPVCIITGGIDVICLGSSTTWSAPGGMASYSWAGPSGFTSSGQSVTVNLSGNYTLIITDSSGASSCSRNLSVYPELSAGSINTTLGQFCTGGTTVIGGTNPPYGPASDGSGSFTYSWHMQEGCMGGWVDIPGSNLTSFTPDPPLVTACYRRKVTDLVCNNEAFTDFKRFEIFSDPVSQTILPQPEELTICAGTPVSATFTGGSGGFPGGTEDIIEFSTNGGTSWSSYPADENIATDGLSGVNVVRVRTRRISTGVNGCNYGLYNSVAWNVNSIPNTSAIFHR